MSVYRRFHDHGLPSLITTNLADRSPLFTRPDAATALIRSLVEARDQLHFRLYAWVLMPDHLHLVVGMPPGIRSGAVMRLVKARFARRWNHQMKISGPIWQTRFHERLLTSEKALLAAIDYVHANPVTTGLVLAAEDYTLSSARAWAERSQAELLSHEPAVALLRNLQVKPGVGTAPA